jgi:nucleoside-triphosphatase THEP1
MQLSHKTQEYATLMFQESQGHYNNTLMEKLNFAASAPYACVSKAKRGPCADGTRDEVLEQMLEWVHTGTGPVYWINGIAGTGKTTICYSLCRKLESMNQLAASFFCTGTLLECKTIGNIFPSIAYQLAAFCPHYARELHKILRNNYGVVMSDLRTQYKQLIEGPLRPSPIRNAPSNTVVVVIDALDECESEDADISDILDLLLGTEDSIPIKFFVSSRPEPAIQNQLTNRQHLHNNQIALHKLDRGKVQKDIRTYLDAELRRLDTPSRSLAIPEHYIDKLASRSGGLFIYASTAVHYILQSKYANSPLLGLEAILHAPHSSEAHSLKNLDQLYKAILAETFKDDMLPREEKEVMKLVLHTIICVQEPLTIAEINALLKLGGEEKVLSALEPFLSILYIAGMEPNESKSSQRVAVIHVSFLEFIFDADRSKEWYCNASTRHDALSNWCFEGIQQASPKFNICGLKSSHKSDDDVTGLKDMVNASISNQLFYACRYWSTHYSLSNRSPGLLSHLEKFFSNDLLLWMEVMNLNKVIMAGPNIIRCAIACLVSRIKDALK